MREQLGETLVSQLTHMTKESDPNQFAHLCASMRRTLRNAKTGTASDMFEMDSKFKGLIQKARIRSQDNLADALDHTYAALQADVGERQPMEPGIKMATLPDHLQFLICLSLPAAPATHTYASLVLDKAKDPFRVPSALTWETIMAEEPFEGQHWEDAQSNPQSRKAKRRTSSWSSSNSLSDLSDDDHLQSVSSSPPTTHAPSEKRVDDTEDFVSSSELAAVRSQMELDEMLGRQYWKAHWRIDVDLDAPFDLSNAETLAPTFMRSSAGDDARSLLFGGPGRGKFINEVDAMREVLLALQGLDNNLLVLHPGAERGPPTVDIRPSAPQLVHLTTGTYFSLLAAFASAAAVPERLHYFLTTIARRRTNSQQKAISLTAEAFAETVELHIRDFHSWCSLQEQTLCMAQGGTGPSIAVSLLNLSHELEDRISILKLLLDVVEKVQQSTAPARDDFDIMNQGDFGIAPLAISINLLDFLFAAYKSQYSMANEDDARKLLQIFLAAAQPMWRATTDWLREGKAGELMYDEDALVSVNTGDFFIRHDAEVPMSDPSFWTLAYDFHTLEGQGNRPSIPAFLHSMTTEILAAGKARALLNALGLGLDDFQPAKRLSDVVALSQAELWEPRDLEATVTDHLLPQCALSQQQLNRLVVDTCQMWHHLAAIEDVYLFRRGDMMDAFADIIFDRLETRHTWFDFHALNAAFRDILAARSERLIDASLLRFWYTKPRDDAAARMTRCLSGLSVTYEVPIPLLYLLTPDTLLRYSAIFVLLTQLRRAKRLIDGIIVRRRLRSQLELGEDTATDDIKIFFALRSKLSWFLNALTYFIYTTIHAQLHTFHGSLKAARTLDDMVKVHESHLERLSTKCLLSETTNSLHKAVVNILDIALQFGDCYAALSGGTLVGSVRRPVSTSEGRRRRPKRPKRHLRKQNLVGFSEAMPAISDEDTSDSDDDDAPDTSVLEPSMSMAVSISFADENLTTRLDRMSNEMDRLVRYLRRGAEKIAGEGGPDTTTFEVLAFTLEDWDL
ncbi:hypothetical protein CALVIDRAFT_597152 [Calocera viscosa TUFC12733]|uniref:Spindle pole body component n=1 Tax=Calocera viscosa (strain TUFC12733) TaxID=1330018 RepID=A0A167NWZ6_CALVF|nr:hypothetical protein CALVIDRAFT_597152 [Calocera viscosa TUFC12733]